MKKLRLELAELQVETFETLFGAGRGAGTVDAAAHPDPGTDDTLKPDCDVSGSPTCGYTNCADESCGTCDDASWCGNSCILVCDGGAGLVPIIVGTGRP